MVEKPTKGDFGNNTIMLLLFLFITDCILLNGLMVKLHQICILTCCTVYQVG